MYGYINEAGKEQSWKEEGQRAKWRTVYKTFDTRELRLAARIASGSRLHGEIIVGLEGIHIHVSSWD